MLSMCKCLTFYWQAGCGPSTENHSCFCYNVYLILLTGLICGAIFETINDWSAIANVNN